MTDIVSKAVRSKMMAAVKSSRNRSTEEALRKLLMRSRITGWRANVRTLPGSPDFAFRGARLAIFVDGCFWHGCEPCSKGRSPVNNRKYWSQKIEANKRRDRRAGRALRERGWKVVRVWEHTLERRPEAAIGKICRALTI